MKTFTGRILALLFLGCLIGLLTSLQTTQAKSPDVNQGTANGLALSDMYMEISSDGRTATFRLYDTVAAKELYNQLPLSLDLSNFRDAQWIFYPPEKLSVSRQEAYHDGRKGELSYYAPWGDVFMIYKDFHAGDEMHRLGIGISGINEIAGMSGHAVIEKKAPNQSKGDKTMQISIVAGGQEIIFELNDSQASKDLYSQLPLTIKVENYSSNEKIFYPSRKLGTGNTPLVKSAGTGTLAYYAPWRNVVMFYGSFGSASGLYELGHAVKGSDRIRKLSGTIKIIK